MTRASIALATALAAATFAGCLASQVDEIEPGDADPIDLASLALGKTGGEAKPAYGYWSGELDATWVAFRVPVPRSEIERPPAGDPYVRIHVVGARVESGHVAELPFPATPRDEDPQDGVLAVIGYAESRVGVNERFASVNGSLAPRYANFTLSGASDAAIPEEVLVVVGALSSTADDAPVRLALVLRVGGPEPVDAASPARWREALASLSADRLALPLEPVASGVGFGMDVYRAFPPTLDLPGVVRARGVEARERSDLVGPLGAAAERTLELSLTRDVPATSRVLFVAGEAGGAAAGTWTWSWTSATGETRSGSASFAQAANRGFLAGTAGTTTEPPGTISFHATLRDRATVASAPLVALLIVGIDIEAVWGTPTVDMGIGAANPLPPILGLPA